MSGARNGSFVGVGSLLNVLGRRYELPPKLASFGALDELASTGYYDTDAESLLVRSDLGTPTELGGTRGEYAATGTGDGHPDFLGLTVLEGLPGSGLISAQSFRGIPIHQGCGPGSFSCE